MICARVGRGLQADVSAARPAAVAAARAGRRSRPASCRCPTAAAPGRRATSSPPACCASNRPLSSETLVLPRMIAPAALSFGDQRGVGARHRLLQRDRAAGGRQARDVDRRRRAAPGCRAAGRARRWSRARGRAACASSTACVLSARTACSAGPSALVSAIRARYAFVSVSALSVPAVMPVLQRLRRLRLQRERQRRRGAADRASSSTRSPGCTSRARRTRGAGTVLRAAVHARVDLARPACAASSPARSRTRRRSGRARCTRCRGSRRSACAAASSL